MHQNAQISMLNFSPAVSQYVGYSGTGDKREFRDFITFSGVCLYR